MARSTRRPLLRITASTRPMTTAVSWDTTVSAMAIRAPSRKPSEVRAWVKIVTSKFTRRPDRLFSPARRRSASDRAQVGRVQVVLGREPGQRAVVLQRLEGRRQGSPDIGFALAVIDPIAVRARDRVRHVVLARVLQPEVGDRR